MGIIVEGQRRWESVFYGLASFESFSNDYSVLPFCYCCAVVIIAFVSLVQKIHAYLLFLSVKIFILYLVRFK